METTRKTKRTRTKVVIENANTITTGVVNYLRLKGHMARRINTTGIYDPRSGNFRKIANDRKGVSDVIACINGTFIGIEIKFKKDKQSKDQKAFQSELINAGGIYIIAKTYNEFLNWYKENIDII